MEETIEEILGDADITAGHWNHTQLRPLTHDSRLARFDGPIVVSADNDLADALIAARAISRARAAGGPVDDATCDLWILHALGAAAVIPTNTTRKRDGSAVMGAGLAKTAAARWPDLPARYGRALGAGHTCLATEHGLLLAPTKHHWSKPSTIQLVTDTVKRLNDWAEAKRSAGADIVLAVPALGAGLGQLDWQTVHAAEHAGFTVPAVLLPPR